MWNNKVHEGVEESCESGEDSPVVESFGEDFVVEGIGIHAMLTLRFLGGYAEGWGLSIPKGS